MELMTKTRRFAAALALGATLALPAAGAGAQTQTQDGLVNVAVGDVTILRDVNVAVAAEIAANICGVDVGPVAVLGTAVDMLRRRRDGLHDQPGPGHDPAELARRGAATGGVHGASPCTPPRRVRQGHALARPDGGSRLRPSSPLRGPPLHSGCAGAKPGTRRAGLDRPPSRARRAWRSCWPTRSARPSSSPAATTRPRPVS